MARMSHIYEVPTLIQIADNMSLICEKGIKLIVVNACFDEHYMYELTHHWREGLKEKKLKEGDIVEVIGVWHNFYGSYIRCTMNDEVYDVKPKNLSYNSDL